MNMSGKFAVAMAGVGLLLSAAQKITCFTCHRGAVKPLTAPGGGGADR